MDLYLMSAIIFMTLGLLALAVGFVRWMKHRTVASIAPTIGFASIMAAMMMVLMSYTNEISRAGLEIGTAELMTISFITLIVVGCAALTIISFVLSRKESPA